MCLCFTIFSYANLPILALFTIVKGMLLVANSSEFTRMSLSVNRKPEYRPRDPLGVFTARGTEDCCEMWRFYEARVAEWRVEESGNRLIN